MPTEAMAAQMAMALARSGAVGKMVPRMHTPIPERAPNRHPQTPPNVAMPVRAQHVLHKTLTGGSELLCSEP